MLSWLIFFFLIFLIKNDKKRFNRCKIADFCYYLGSYRISCWEITLKKQPIQKSRPKLVHKTSQFTAFEQYP